MKATLETPAKRVFWALNRDNKTVTVLHGFSCFELVQGAFRSGIMMPDGTQANGIGRSKSLADFTARANKSEYTIL